jgi:hypothetical protein
MKLDEIIKNIIDKKNNEMWLGYDMRYWSIMRRQDLVNKIDIFINNVSNTISSKNESTLINLYLDFFNLPEMNFERHEKGLIFRGGKGKNNLIDCAPLINSLSKEELEYLNWTIEDVI